MKSTDLAVIISPFAALANKHAMSPIYNTLEISADTIRGCAPWGVLEVDAEIGTKETFWVNSLHFVGVIKTLPAGEVVFSQTGTTLSWECGNAQGKYDPGDLIRLSFSSYFDNPDRSLSWSDSCPGCVDFLCIGYCGSGDLHLLREETKS